VIPESNIAKPQARHSQNARIRDEIVDSVAKFKQTPATTASWRAAAPSICPEHLPEV
jgi:hypothetical protein